MHMLWSKRASAGKWIARVELLQVESLLQFGNNQPATR
jgi:hypothetical protein